MVVEPERCDQKALRPRLLGGFPSVKIRDGGGSFLLQHIITEAKPKSSLTS